MGYIVKLTTPWSHDFYMRTPRGTGIFGEYKFEIDNAVAECDYWFVWGDLPKRTHVKCPPENIYYITDEAHNRRKFNKDFLQQFPSVITQRGDISHSNIIKTHDLGIWHFPINYDTIEGLQEVPKSKEISAVSSDLTFLDGHKLRFAFINQLIGHYKSKIDVYGRGINAIENKFDAIAPYRYSVAIENSFLPNYFTEKIFECFLTLTFPIYFGCPNLEDYFDERSFARIDIKDLAKSIAIIDDVIRYDIHTERLTYIKEAKKLFLEKYMVFPALVNILKNASMTKAAFRKKSCVKFPEREFLPFSSKVLNSRYFKKYVSFE